MSEKPKPQPFSRTLWMSLGAFLLIVGLIMWPFVRREIIKADQTHAISSLRQMGFALFEFEHEYGSFPNEKTAELVQKKHPSSTNLSGNSSNALFRQLFAAELTQSEEMFYAKIPGAKKADGDVSAGKLLEKGEVAFGCIAGLTVEGNLARPIAFAPIIPGTTKFDPGPFLGKAVILRLDNSASSLDIDADGHAIMDGQDMLSPEHPIWNGKAPDIRYPEL